MMLRSWMKALLPVAVVLLGMAEPALAQEEKPWTEPGLQYLETARPLAQWGLGILFIILMAFCGFKNPHRTHLD